MARPRSDTVRRIVSDKYSVGYCAPHPNNPEVIYTRVRNIWKTTRLKWGPAKRPSTPTIVRAKEILDERILAAYPELRPASYTSTRTKPETPQQSLPDGPVMLFPAMAEFLLDLPASDRKPFARLFAIYFTRNVPLDGYALRDLLNERDAILKYSKTTRNSYHSRLGRFFQEMREQGKLLKDPRKLMESLALPSTHEAYTYTDDEQNAIVTGFYDAGELRLALLCQILPLSSMRISEALGLTVEDVDIASGFVVRHGKRNRGEKKRGEPGRRRKFPFFNARGEELIPGLRSLFVRLMELVPIPVLDRTTGITEQRLFTHLSAMEVTTKFQKLKAKLGIIDPPRPAYRVGAKNRSSRNIHTYRAMAKHLWRYDLKLSPEVRSMLAGHSIRMEETNYSREASMEEISAAATPDL